MKIPVIARTAALLCALTALPATALPPPPALPGSWKWVPEFSDEFNAAELDLKKWQPHHPGWPGRPPGFLLERNVVQKEGKLELHLKAENVPGMPEGYKDYTCGILRSRSRIRYGYFEIRARAAASNGTSAFRFSHEEPERWTGIGIFELAPRHPRSGRTLFTDAPVLRYPGLAGPLDHHQEIPLQADPSAGFQIWGLHWDAGVLTWFLDGKPLRTLTNTHWKTPLRLMLDTGTHPEKLGLPDRADLPAVFTIDYVRSWQSTPP
jgi:beta-glucanase (GH16 family)